MGRGVDRRRIFCDDEDYQLYVRLLATAVREFGWILYAFCLMPNHVHLFIRTTKPNVGEGMRWLHGMYARLFNQRIGQVGHRFEGRYRAPLPVQSDEKFLDLVGYIAVNPVDAGLVKRARDWPWSSHHLVAAGHTPRWLAHEQLLDRLELITGFDCYDPLIATHERSLLTRPRR